MLLKLPKDVQKIIWKLVFDNTLENLKQFTEDIASVFDDYNWIDGYRVGLMEKCRFYQYVRCNDKTWCLLIGAGKHACN